MLDAAIPDSTTAPPFLERPVLDPREAPEARLLLAVLHDALETWQRGLRSRAGDDVKAFREVDRWFRSDDYDWPFSFENICSTIGVDADHVRDGLHRLRVDAALHRAPKKKRMVARSRLATGRPATGRRDKRKGTPLPIDPSHEPRNTSPSSPASPPVARAKEQWTCAQRGPSSAPSLSPSS